MGKSGTEKGEDERMGKGGPPCLEWLCLLP